MKEQELISKLNNLKRIKPDNAWKNGSREILLNQINGSTDNNKEFGEFSWLNSILIKLPARTVKSVNYSVMAVILIGLLMLSSGVVSLNAARESKPGDSLYVAKKISEKTKYALTFNEKKKASLNLEFASNRIKELSDVLAEEGNGGRQEKVDQLVEDFKKEINTLRSSVERIAAKSPEKKVRKIAESKEEPGPEDNKLKQESAKEPESEESASVFSANIGKDENGIQVSDPLSEPAGGQDPGQEYPEKEENPALGTSTEDELTATASPEIKAGTSTKEAEAYKEDGLDPEAILKQAELLLNSENYDETLNKLDEADLAIGQVSGNEKEDKSIEEEAASSTESGEKTAGNEAAGKGADIENVEENSEAVDPESASTTKN